MDFVTLLRACRGALVAAIMLIGASAAAEDAPAAASVSPAVLAALERGINLSFWFTYRNDPSIDPKLWHPDAADLAALAHMGLRHARIPVDHAWIADAKNDEQLDAAHAAELGDAVAQVAAAHLLAVVTLTGDDAFTTSLRSKPAALKRASGLWWNLAKKLAARAPASALVFEVLNEPGGDDPAVSAKVMQTLAGAVRDAAPAYTIAVAGQGYSDVDELVAMTPFLDRNLVYSFHFYEPHNFTHQGANWGYAEWAKFRGFPYPSSPEAVAPLLDKLDPEARPHAQFYGEQRWDRDKLAAILDRAADWSRRNGVPLWCSEFGVLKTATPPDAREAWLRDTRELLEARGIGWAHFDFVDHFGIADGPQGARVWDRKAIAALGLKAP